MKENKYSSKVTEEQKTEICNSIDCTKLSPDTVVDCVQNPRMPLRFIVRAMLVEHLHTRRSLIAAATGAAQPQVQQYQEEEESRTSLGEFLHRDSARRQTAQLKQVMDSTYSRIQSLEKELRGMKKILLDHQPQEKEKIKENAFNSERPASFHFVPADHNENSSKIQRGGRGSVSSSGFLLRNVITNKNEMEEYDIGSNGDGGSGTPTRTRTLRHRFITGLKNAFRIQNSASNVKVS